jgi:phosphopantothenoylcysteine decarboxylase/phosphopantothenate--cysteine ligase
VARGARVTLVSANVALPPPAGAEVVPVGTARELQDAVRAACRDADAVVMAAAVADFRPAGYQAAKIKKDEGGGAPDVPLVRNPDVLAGLVADPPREKLLVVGFAAETGDATGSVLDHGRAKLARKGVDLLVVNEVGEERGFESAENAAVVLGRDGMHTAVPLGPKELLAHAVWDLVAARLP